MMNKTEKIKEMNYIPVLVAFFLLMRTFFLTDIYDFGISGLSPFELDFAGENIAFIVLIIVFAILVGLVVSKLSRKFGSIVYYLSILLVMEPLLFAKQVNCIALFIVDIGLAFFLNGLRDKPIVPNEITLVVFLLVSCILDENAIFLFVAPALIAYFFEDIEKIFKNVKKIVMLILSAVSIGAGILINNFLVENVPDFKSAINAYTFADQIYFKHIGYENILLFVFLIPSLFLGYCFFSDTFKMNKGKSLTGFRSMIFFVVGAYILSIIGFVTGGSDNFYTVNFIIPISIISMLNGKNYDAERTMGKVNDLIQKHLLVCFSVVLLLYFFAMVIFYNDTNNIGSFILAR